MSHVTIVAGGFISGQAIVLATCSKLIHFLRTSMNLMGGVSHPSGTNHFDPRSTLFQPHHREFKLISELSSDTL